MPPVLHLLDGDVGWQERTALAGLLDRASSDDAAPAIATIAPRALKRIGQTLGKHPREIEILGRCDRLPLLSAPAVARGRVAMGDPVVHAWGIRAALAARAAGATRVVLSLFDPTLARSHAKRIRALAETPGFVAACSCEVVLRRLVEGGVPPRSAVVVRPSVDFAAINRYRKGTLRSELGVSHGDRLIVLPHPVSRSAGQIDAYWAVQVLRVIDGAYLCAVPGWSRQRDRIHRLDRELLGDRALVSVPESVPFEQLVSVADVLLLAGHGDTPTTCIAWAMAAETLVVGPATYSVAELIGSGLNGLLYKPVRAVSAAPAIMKCLRNEAAHAKLTEVARGHAFEVFAAQRNAEQYARLYDNLVRGVDPGSHIVDSAVSA
ncbi:MAG: hypothetical protein ACE5E5_08840 [Phycisphaerae bacterium]